MRLLLVILLIALVVGAWPAWPHAMAWNLGYFPSVVFSLILLVVILAALPSRRDDPI